MDNNQYNQNSVMDQFESNFNKKRSPVVKVILAVVLVVLCVAGFLFYKESQRVHINLNNYLDVNISGYDGYGNANAHFKRSEIMDDYAADFEVDNYYKIVQMEDYLDDCIEYEVIAPENLKNGDTVIVKWDVDKKAFEKRYECRLEFETVTIKVNDLKEFEEYDPFEQLQVSFSGNAPYASVEIDKFDMDYRFFEFNIDKSENLKNGDIVTISIEKGDDFEQKCIDYGVSITCDKKEYTVSGLDGYVEKIADIPEDGMNSMKKQAEDVFNAYVARDWENPASMKGFNYIGSYYLTGKEFSYWSDTNVLYLVYEVNYDSGKEEEEPFTYYYYVCFYDLMMLGDGTFSVDLGNYGQSNDYWGDQRFKKYDLNFNGYEKLESMFSHCVTENIDGYNYESTVP